MARISDEPIDDFPSSDDSDIEDDDKEELARLKKSVQSKSAIINKKLNRLERDYLKLCCSEWKPESCKLFSPTETFALVVCGSRRQGKSTLAFWLLKKFDLVKSYDIIVLFSQTVIADHYLKILGTKLLFDKYDESVIDDVQNKQMEHRKNGKLPRVLYIFDDVISEREVERSPNLKKLFLQGRNMNSSVIMLANSITLIPTDYRENVDFFIVFRQKTGSKIEVFKKTYLRFLMPEPMHVSIDKEYAMRVIISEHTSNHGCIVIEPDAEKFYHFRLSKKENDLVWQ